MKREYKIYLKNLADGKTEDVERFEADNPEEAIKRTKSYREAANCAAGKEYYWDYVVIHIQLDEHGKEVDRAESIHELHEKMKSRETKSEKIRFFFRVVFDRISDKYYKIKYAFQRMFRGYDDVDSFSISDRILNFLLHNIPIMIENLHGCPTKYCERASELIEKSNGFEFDGYPQKSSLSMNIAMALWKTRLENILKSARLYLYYSSYGIQSADDENWINPSDYPIPLMECTESLIDYEKLYELQENAKNKMFDYLREDFGAMWN